jgi:tetratricopeptide (TPR) repeat protein
MLNFRYQAASQLEDFDEVVATATAMQENYPDDPCLDLLMIDTYVLQEKFDEANECIDRVASVVGGDPLLAGMKGAILIAAKKFDEAKQVLEQAIAEEADLVDNYWNMVTLGLETGDHALTYDYLKRIESQFEIIPDNMPRQPEYAAFVASPEGKQWLSEQGL